MNNPTQGGLAQERSFAPMLAGYASEPGAYDELLGPTGVRAHWQPIIEELAHPALHQEATTRGGGPGRDRTRPWRLDALPFMVDADEWAVLEAGLLQRSRLLNDIVADLYGEQKLLRFHGLPPALVLANPQYKFALRGQRAPNGVFLHLIAFDLGRSPDGQWRVLNNRTETPIGLGFALENRVIVARQYADLLPGAGVIRLAGFFRAYGRRLTDLGRAALDGHAGLTVLLTTGPDQAPYFEHTYLGRYLGFPVVEGSDLTVRNRRVFLKTLEGLKPVGAVMRHVESDLADPLELSSQSLAGTPGLANAARNGDIILANALGSGVVQNEALMGFLPGLCEALLGEELKLPSLATWWCGQPEAAAEVVKRVNEFVIRSAFAAEPLIARSVEGYRNAPTGAVNATELRRAIGEQPHAWVAREHIALSTAPYWHEDERLAPGPMTLRVFVAATEAGYQLMPGGLARVATPEGDIAKDVWVRGTGETTLPPRRDASVIARRSDRDLPSRTADDLFWLGRYLERAEGAVRAYRSLFRYMTDGGNHDYSVELEILTDVLVSLDYLSARRAREAVALGRQAVEKEIWQILFDTESADGLATLLNHVHRTADHVRERLSNDAWRIFEALPATPSLRWQLHGLGDALRLLDSLIVNLSAVTGQLYDNTTRGYGWRLQDLGRRIERVRFSVRVIRQLVDEDPFTTQRLELLLDIQDSTITYWSRYQAAPTMETFLDLLILDDSNPRSMLNQIERMQRHVLVMPQENRDSGPSAAQRIVLALSSDLQLAEVSKLAGVLSKNGRRTHLQRLLRRTEDAADRLSDLIGETYFKHTNGRHRL